jgi:hypothetical protein
VTQSQAHHAVYLAVKSGQLKSLHDGATACVDCGEGAKEYDHRDYDFPLQVEPVCTSCNRKRGPAKNALPFSDMVTTAVVASSPKYPNLMKEAAAAEILGVRVKRLQD